MTQDNQPIIQIDNISLNRSTTAILSDISLSVHPGEHWAILGPNGSGKTTLINIITAYLWPSSGTVTVLGDRYGSVDIRDKRRHIGIVSSAMFERIPPRETMADVVLSGHYGSLGIFDEASEGDRSRAREIMDFLHCEHLADSPYSVLSFGERQRALIGRALMAEPDILILDEPCEGLDINARETLLNRLDSLIATPGGPALLLVTHRIEEIPSGMTHALILKDGMVLSSGTKGEVITSKILSGAMNIGIDVVMRNGRLFAVVR